MKIKTYDLTGPALDWAVCCVEGQQMSQYTRYSTDWSQGGPIIEREKISVMLSFAGSHAEGADARPTGWMARKYVYGVMLEPLYYGPTPLVAAMRCFVASRLGDEIEVPKELNPEELNPED